MENNLQVMNFIRPTRFLSTALKVWLGFLLLIVKCKREEIKETLAKTNQEDLIWKILSLSQLQKTLKLGSSLSENYERKPMVCQDKLLLEPWKDQKVRIFSHTESPLKKLSIWLSFSRQLRCLDLLCSFGLLLWAIVPMTISFQSPCSAVLVGFVLMAPLDLLFHPCWCCLGSPEMSVGSSGNGGLCSLPLQ